MVDVGHNQTDKILEDIEKRLSEEYTKAYKEVEKKAADYFTRFEKKDKEKKRLVDAGKLTEKEYQTWRKNQMLSGKRWTDLRDQLAKDLTNTNQIAAGIVWGELNEVFAINANYSEYLIENGMQINYGFTLYDRNTIANLVANDPDIIPWKPVVNIKEDLRWNRQMITSHITQGILQGESIPNLSKRLLKTVNNDKVAAVRTARTAVTSSQNAGRQMVYDRAKKMGLKLRKSWMATLDGRTRHDHGMADGQEVDLDKPFTVGGEKMMYPGDMRASPSNCYNCRCSMVTVEPPNITKGEEPRMTYSEWIESKEGKKAIQKKKDAEKQKRDKEKEKRNKQKEREKAKQEKKSNKEKQEYKQEKPIYEILGVEEKYADISTLPKETQKLVQDSVRKSFEKFPQLKGHLTRIEYDETIEAIASSKSITGSIKLSKKFKDYQALQKSYDYDVRLKWHPKGTTAQSTITHEIGHQLDGLLTKKGIYGGSINQYGVTRTSVAVQKEVLNRIGLSDEKLREIRKQYADMGYKGKDLTHAVQFERKEFIETHICTYAAENSNEFFACLYAEYMDSPEPREAAKIFGEILERIMGEVK